MTNTMKSALCIFFLFVVVNASSGPTRHDKHQHLHNRGTQSPSGYEQLFSASNKLPSFDSCINYQTVPNPGFATQDCAKICSEDKSCKFFAIWRVPSELDMYCGWWGRTFAKDEVTESQTDEGQNISNASGFNQQAQSSSRSSVSTKVTSSTGIKISTVASNTVISSTSKGLSPAVTSSTTSTNVTPTTSTRSTTNTSGKATATLTTSAIDRSTSASGSPRTEKTSSSQPSRTSKASPISTSTTSTLRSASSTLSSTSSSPPSSTTTDINILTSTSIPNYNFLYASATGIPPTTNYHQLNWYHVVTDPFKACPSYCDQTPTCQFFTIWSMQYRYHMDYYTLYDCAIYNTIFTAQQANITFFDDHDVNYAIAYAKQLQSTTATPPSSNIPMTTTPPDYVTYHDSAYWMSSTSLSGYSQLYTSATAIPPQTGWHMLNYYDNIDQADPMQECADLCTQTKGCAFFVAWENTGVERGGGAHMVVPDCAVYDKVFKKEEGTLEQFDGGWVRFGVGFAKV